MSVQLGYEDRRVELEQFVERQYITAFDLKPCRMLDLGCGDGFWADIFAGRGYTVVGIDRDTDALAIARARPPADTLADDGPHRNPIYVAVDFDDAEQLRVLADAAPEPFELIFARTLPHFYAETLERGTLLISRLLDTPGLLADGGMLLLSIYTNQTGRDQTGQYHHTATDLIACTLRAGGMAGRARCRESYWQIGVWRR